MSRLKSKIDYAYMRLLKENLKKTLGISPIFLRNFRFSKVRRKFSWSYKNLINRLDNRVNYDYIKLIKELPLLIKFNLKNIAKDDLSGDEKKILIINTCLVGEFIVSLHALRHFIRTTGRKVDLLVSPAVKPLAERIRGVNKVYTVKSLYDRAIEKGSKVEDSLANYEVVLVMRLSSEAEELLDKIEYRAIRSYLKPYLKYVGNFINNMIIRGKAKQWKDVNFEIIEKRSRNLHFHEIFNFKKSEYNSLKKLPEFLGNEKKIIIHTCSGWNVKRWGEEKWVELIKRINKLGKFRFIFIGGSDDEEKTYNNIQKKLDFKIYSLIKKRDIKDLAMIMKLSDYFIGIDSGPMNLAHLAGLPSVALFGPGQRAFVSKNKKNVSIDKANCLFCTSFFCHKWKTCMNKISVEDVFKGFLKISGEKEKAS
jgi:ADP-heptose:LPS heptosyltransferase